MQMRKEILTLAGDYRGNSQHLSSKSANYGKALKYLIFQHDEHNCRQLRDENGNRMQRKEYYLDGMNSDPFSFDKEGEMLNADYHKNQTRGEVKSHHYIISFDPKDVTECGQTGEKSKKWLNQSI